MSFNAWLTERLLRQKESSRTSVGYLEAIVSIFGNVFLFAVKLIIGLLINSLSLIADAFHSLSDVLTSVVVLIGFKIGGRPADKEHPFGHGRVETISTLIIAFLLFIVTYDIGKSAIQRIIKPETVDFNILAVIFMILSAAFKEWMASLSIYLGKKINSTSLIADAWHHRSDAIASFLVGIGLIFARFGIYRVDGILAIFVAVLIGVVAFELMKSSTNMLIGEAPDSELVEKIRKEALSVKHVMGVHDIFIHDYNINKVISLHLEVKGELSADEAHDIATAVEDRVKELSKAISVTAHIDPYERKDGS